jgi:hypothetical protein
MSILRFLIPLLIILGSAYVAYPYLAPYVAAPCSEAIAYSVAKYDERFSISRAGFEAALSEAAAVWNEAAGKELVVLGEGGVEVEMRYGEAQQNSELGERIDGEQEAYDAKRAEVETMKDEYEDAKAEYDRLSAAFSRQEKEYASQVAYWNERGGAPPEEYRKLEDERQDLKRAEREVNERVPIVNRLAKELNQEVDALNALAGTINRKVNAYNEHADDDYDQGKYVRDETGAHIYLYEFSDRTELVRVLVHEFGHALGMGHVENPESIMFAYDVGEGLNPTPEDLAELKRACALDN